MKIKSMKDSTGAYFFRSIARCLCHWKKSIRIAIVVANVWSKMDVVFADDLLQLDNGIVQVGIDREKGAAITWLSWKDYPKNIVNVADPGRLIQQSYYAGKSLDRTAEGQSKAWSPWSWNPIQGGGIGSWARVTEFRRDDKSLFAETIPKLWDMPNEEAEAIMRQWTSFEPNFPEVIVMRCELISKRHENDRWGAAKERHQEVPACYFTRNFELVKSYLGDGKWRDESQPPGPPWGKAQPPLKAMAFFESGGQGVAIYSPVSTQAWNFGPHGVGLSSDPTAGPCMHVAPIDLVRLGPRSIYRYRYWIVVGSQEMLATRLDQLIKMYANEQTEFSF
ncbi:MAG: hypothetical protein SGI77_24185 [Pirellulaceae bacterium]|nr:hypothetical protein [Pirellulaceae bacterium]